MDSLSEELRQEDHQARVMADRVCRGPFARSEADTQEAIRQEEIDLKLKIAIREAIEEEEKKQKEKK